MDTLFKCYDTRSENITKAPKGKLFLSHRYKSCQTTKKHHI